MGDIEFESKAEEYLHESEGVLNTFYDARINGATAGMAFLKALSRPDVYRLRAHGDYIEEIMKSDNIDGGWITGAIAYLKATTHRYPEDHPIWNLR